MDEQPLNYIYLDTRAEREELIAHIRQVRDVMRATVQEIPQDQWYLPRYHGWSLAALVGHLNLSDNLSMLLIRTSLIGLPLRASKRSLDGLNDFTGRLFQKRVLSSSLTSMDRNYTRIADLILNLPVNKFSTRIFNPGTQAFTTVERGVQEFFLFHWQEHLNTIRQTEGFQSSTTSDNG